MGWRRPGPADRRGPRRPAPPRPRTAPPRAPPGATAPSRANRSSSRSRAVPGALAGRTRALERLGVPRRTVRGGGGLGAPPALAKPGEKRLVGRQRLRLAQGRPRIGDGGRLRRDVAPPGAVRADGAELRTRIVGPPDDAAVLVADRWDHRAGECVHGLGYWFGLG